MLLCDSIFKIDLPVLNPGLNLQYSSVAPKPFSYSAPVSQPSPKSPIAYPPPATPTWSASETVAPKVPPQIVTPGKCN